MSVQMVDEAMLPFPSSVSVFSEKVFGKYFEEQKRLDIEIKHSLAHFGYVTRLKYSEKVN